MNITNFLFTPLWRGDTIGETLCVEQTTRMRCFWTTLFAMHGRFSNLGTSVTDDQVRTSYYP